MKASRIVTGPPSAGNVLRAQLP
ncbi:DUF2867 domain-containing protein, partial [Enterococcus sp. HPCN18]